MGGGRLHKFYLNETVQALMADSGLDRTTSEELVKAFCDQAQVLTIGIKENISQKNLPGAGLLLHRLKGSAGNVRAREIARLALEVEGALECLDVDKMRQMLREIEEILRKFKGDREGA